MESSRPRTAEIVAWAGRGRSVKVARLDEGEAGGAAWAKAVRKRAAGSAKKTVSHIRRNDRWRKPFPTVVRIFTSLALAKSGTLVVCPFHMTLHPVATRPQSN